MKSSSVTWKDSFLINQLIKLFFSAFRGETDEGFEISFKLKIEIHLLLFKGFTQCLSDVLLVFTCRFFSLIMSSFCQCGMNTVEIKVSVDSRRKAAPTLNRVFKQTSPTFHTFIVYPSSHWSCWLLQVLSKIIIIIPSRARQPDRRGSQVQQHVVIHELLKTCLTVKYWQQRGELHTAPPTAQQLQVQEQTKWLWSEKLKGSQTDLVEYTIYFTYK